RYNQTSTLPYLADALLLRYINGTEYPWLANRLTLQFLGSLSAWSDVAIGLHLPGVVLLHYYVVTTESVNHLHADGRSPIQCALEFVQTGHNTASDSPRDFLYQEVQSPDNAHQILARY